MPTIRRKSGALAAELSYREESVSDGGVESCGESEAPRQPAAKRARKSVSSCPKASTRAKAKTKKRVPLCNLPVDVQYCIFAELDPGDLVSLTRTCKSIRVVLMTQNSISVWKTSRSWDPNIPQCPEDVSEPEWANLLLGGATCQECCAKGVQNIDFAIRRRLCKGCKSSVLVPATKFCATFPDYEEQIMDLVLSTNVSAYGWCQRSSIVREDVHKMAKIYNSLKHDIHMRKTDARKKFDDFVERRRRVVAASQRLDESCIRWVSYIAESRRQSSANLVSARWGAIQDRLRELGYEEQDYRTLRHEHEVQINRKLTDLIWTRIGPELAQLAERNKQQRLARDREQLIKARLAVINARFDIFKATLPAKRWAILPPYEALLSLQEFATLVNCPSADILTEAQLEEPFRAAEAFVSEYVKERSVAIASLVPVYECSEDDNGLALATAVFECRTNGGCGGLIPYIKPSMRHQAYQRSAPFASRAIFGLDGALSHRCPDDAWAPCYRFQQWDGTLARSSTKEPELEYSMPGRWAIKHLLGLLSMSTTTTTRNQLDQRNARFICVRCDGDHFTGIPSKAAMTWEHCVSHFIEYSRDSTGTCTPNMSIALRHVRPHPELLFQLVPEESMPAILEEERALKPVQDYDRSFACNHCAAHLNNLQTRSTASEHVRSKHAVMVPMMSRDVVCVSFCRPLPRVTGTPKVTTKKIQVNKVPHGSGTSGYRCLLCPSASTRQFIEPGVKNHLKDKHKVTTPSAGIHYAKPSTT